MKNIILKSVVEKIEKNNNMDDFPNISSAIDNSTRLLLEALEKEGLENPKIDTVLTISDGRKFLLRFERIDLD